MMLSEDRGSEELENEKKQRLPGLDLDLDRHKNLKDAPSPSSTLSSVSKSQALPLSEHSANERNLSSMKTGKEMCAKNHDVSEASLHENETLRDKLPISDASKFFKSLEIPPKKAARPPGLDLTKETEFLELSTAELEGIASADSLLGASSACFPSSAQPSLAPSPKFGKQLTSKTVISDTEGGNPHSQKIKKPEAAERLDSIQSSRSIHDVSYLSTRRRPLSSRSAMTPPTGSARSFLRSNPTPNHGSPKSKFAMSGSRSGSKDLNFTAKKQIGNSKSDASSPLHPSTQIPIPSMSIPNYLQLELSSKRPSPLYIYRSSRSEYSYESSRVKYQRLLNFIILPLYLEQALVFGTFACLDAWLHTFTILPLRFFKAAGILTHWWGLALVKESRFISEFIYHGSGRMWNRRHERSNTSFQTKNNSGKIPPRTSKLSSCLSQLRGPVEVVEGQSRTSDCLKVDIEHRSKRESGRRHRRTKSEPSSLSSHNKADLLQGAIVILSCIILMNLDASRMYHYIRGQAAIKLYVIFNVLEVGDKLLAALGQDIFECLFSNEILERDHNGRGKVIRSFLMFILALIYNVSHAAALFFQVITLNVAVNSYSNALFTLLMSNQFVEIKSTVFKKIEKDNLFQLTCADVVERFQLWLILVVIALRNIVEMGGLSVPSDGLGSQGELLREATVPLRSTSILPNSFTILPSWSGEILSPFFLVLGSETLVDWIKHSYISKFNNVKPAIYGRYFDILAKDYYTNASLSQNLVKRLGLPVMPLACLFIRSSVQTYHMFLATHLPSPIPLSVTELSVESATTPPATTAALEHFDTIVLRALGRSTFGVPNPTASNPWYLPGTDDVIAALTMVVFFLGAYLILLVCKLVLGMFLLRFARKRYHGMKTRETQSYDTDGKRLGTWGMTEMDDEKRRWIYQDEPEKLQQLADRAKAAKERTAATSQDLGNISRYEMLKRIW